MRIEVRIVGSAERGGAPGGPLMDVLICVGGGRSVWSGGGPLIDCLILGCASATGAGAGAGDFFNADLRGF